MVRRDDTGRLSYRPFEEYVEVYYLTEFKYKEGNSITSPRPSSLFPCTPPACVSKLDFEYKQEIPPGSTWEDNLIVAGKIKSAGCFTSPLVWEAF